MSFRFRTQKAALTVKEALAPSPDFDCVVVTAFPSSLSTPFFAADEHKALSASFGTPLRLFAVGALFFGLISAHIMLTSFQAHWSACSCPRARP
jgi:hypothetical protein